VSSKLVIMRMIDKAIMGPVIVASGVKKVTRTS
jgi:hypothetical protein